MLKIRKILKWGGVFLIVIGILLSIFLFVGAGALIGIFALVLIYFYAPAFIGLGIILILIERILRKPSLWKIIIFSVFIIVSLIFTIPSILRIAGEFVVGRAKATVNSRIDKITAEAVRLRNPEECLNIYPDTLLPKSLSKFIPTPYQKGDKIWRRPLEKCITTTAIAVDDIAICEKFSFLEDPFTLHMYGDISSELTGRCKAAVAVKRNDIVLCEKIENPSGKKECLTNYYIRLAAETESPEICSQVGSSRDWEFSLCIYGVAIKTGNIELCKKIDKDAPFSYSYYAGCIELDPKQWCYRYFCD